MDVKKRGKSSAHPKPGGELTADERAAVLAVAGELGCMVGAGPHTGKPSMTVLLRDIGAGDIVCKRRRGRKRQTAATQIAELRVSHPELTGPEVARRMGCQPQTVYAVWAKLRADQPQAEIPVLVPCPTCGCAMRQTRRGATLDKRGPAYVCPIDEGEVKRDDSGRRYRRAGFAHVGGVRVWELGELVAGKGMPTG